MGGISLNDDITKHLAYMTSEWYFRGLVLYDLSFLSLFLPLSNPYSYSI
jgi:hypothetical protein